MSERAKRILEREDAAPRIGNLTLIHYGVNRSLQNHEAKRDALFDHSNLQLNSDLTRQRVWSEAAIATRSEDLLNAALRIWPGPVL